MFLEVSLVARFQMCFIKTTLNNISILLLIDQIISASEKKKPIHAYLHILKTFVKIIVKYQR